MWEVLFHPLVVKEDLPAIDTASRKQILKSIQKKLTTNPEDFGSPLRGKLQGYWKLRLANYCVVYTIKKSKLYIKVIKVGARKDFEVYEETLKRVPKLMD